MNRLRASLLVSCLVLSGLAVGQVEPNQATSAPSSQNQRTIWSLPTQAPSFGSAAAGDIDGDGKPEIVFGTYFNDEHVYAVNAEDGSLLWKHKSLGGPIDTSVLIFDVNGDGKLEIIFGDSAYGTLFCLDGSGKQVWQYQGQSGTDSPAAAADLDGDGDIEVVYGTMKSRKAGTGFVNVLEGKTGKLVWSAAVPGHVQSEPALVDVNGDRVLNVLVTNWMGDNHLRALSGKDGSELWKFETGDWVYHGVSFFDFDRDKKPEIVIADRKGQVWMLEGESGKTVWKAELEGERDGMVFGPTSLVDSDRDGVPEIAVCGWHLHLLDAKGRLLWRNEYGRRSIARGVAVSDVDGDGVEDLIFGHLTTLRMVRSDTGKELSAIDIRVGKDRYEHINHAPLVLDLDGDGRLDVFVVIGRGLPGDKEKGNYGRTMGLRGGAGRAGAGAGWLMFRGGPRHSGGRFPSDSGIRARSASDGPSGKQKP